MRVASRYTHAESHALVEVTGAAYQLSYEDCSLKKVAMIEYLSTEATKGGPVLAYLKRHATPSRSFSPHVRERQLRAHQ